MENRQTLQDLINKYDNGTIDKSGWFRLEEDQIRISEDPAVKGEKLDETDNSGRE